MIYFNIIGMANNATPNYNEINNISFFCVVASFCSYDFMTTRETQKL